MYLAINGPKIGKMLKKKAKNRILVSEISAVRTLKNLFELLKTKTPDLKRVKKFDKKFFLLKQNLVIIILFEK